METRLDDEQFRLLGERMKDTWDETSKNGASTPWDHFQAEIDLRNICLRWSLSGDGDVTLMLEEHENRANAFWAARRNDGSIAPLRSVAFRRTRDGWEDVA